jgi:hypothetical protein
MCNRTAYENAGRVLPSLTGPALWVWTRGVVYSHQVPAALRDRASFASVVIPRCPAMEASIVNVCRRLAHAGRRRLARLARGAGSRARGADAP